MNPRPKKIEDVKLWRDVTAIAKQAYAMLEGLPEEEKWGLENRLRQSAFDETDWIAEAYGAIDPRDIKWSFGKARACLFSLKNSISFMRKMYGGNFDPEIMVAIDTAVVEIDKELKDMPKAIKNWYAEMEAPEKKRT